MPKSLSHMVQKEKITSKKFSVKDSTKITLTEGAFDLPNKACCLFEVLDEKNRKIKTQENQVLWCIE